MSAPAAIPDGAHLFQAAAVCEELSCVGAEPRAIKVQVCASLRRSEVIGSLLQASWLYACIRKLIIQYFTT